MGSTKTRPNKNICKRHLFHCFKSDDVVDAKTTDPLLSYIALAEKHGIVLPTVLSSALTMAKGGTGEGNASRRRKIGKYTCSLRIRQALIAALNHTSLGKKIINRRKTNKDTLYRSRISKLEEGDNMWKTKCKTTHGTNSYTSSSNCSPTLTPSSTRSSSSQGTQSSGSSSEPSPYPPRSFIGVTKQKQHVGDSGKGCFGSNMAVSLLFLTSLLVLILWGKFCAIIYTSIGFFVVPPPCPRRIRRCNEFDLV